jgi:hypothetical protein
MNCSDPLKINCKRPVAAGFVVGKTPHNPKHATPCPSCRYKRYALERKRAGLPPVRTKYDAL